MASARAWRTVSGDLIHNQELKMQGHLAGDLHGERQRMARGQRVHADDLA